MLSRELRTNPGSAAAPKGLCGDKRSRGGCVSCWAPSNPSTPAGPCSRSCLTTQPLRLGLVLGATIGAIV